MPKQSQIVNAVVLMAAGLAIAVMLVLLGTGGDDKMPAKTVSRPEREATSLPFAIYWPLQDPLAESAPRGRPLLNGRLNVWLEDPDTDDARVVIGLTLTRPSDEESRAFWNKRLLYSEFGWMSRVRVWDEEKKWLYPNLSYLFKLHGADRVERYGGWDPGKQVDNDYGAVLVRRAEEDAKTLVSARWYPVDVADAGRRTVSHVTRSDCFTVHPAGGGPGDETPQTQRIKVWFIYGDFMKHPVPKAWPDKKEDVGGALAFFYVDLTRRADGFAEPDITLARPEHTGFDWRGWVGRNTELKRPDGEPVLVD